MTESQKCFVCGQHVHEVSHDIWALQTWYTEHGDVAKTGEQADLDIFENDYIVICTQYECLMKVQFHWETFVRAIMGNQPGVET